MDYQSKEEALKRMNDWFSNTFNRYKNLSDTPTLTVHIPIYKSYSKKRFLALLQLFLSERAYKMSPKEKKISSINFSKWVKPDNWKTYEIIDENLLYISDFMIEHECSWENELYYNFLLEDLQYGYQPLIPFEYMDAPCGGGRGTKILLDKRNGTIYDLGSGLWGYDYAKDFNLFKKGKKNNIDWENFENQYLK